MPVHPQPGACPQCNSRAPIVYRGVLAYCTACGASRVPLVAKSTNHAGKASMIGGGLARVFGWIVLSGGVAFGLAMLGILQALFPAGFAGWVVGVPIMVLAIGFGTVLLRGGRSLESTGAAERRETHTAAIFSLAERNGNIVTAAQVGEAIGVPTERADELLTELAKAQPDYVMLEVDDAGSVYYRVSTRGLSRIQSFDQRLRVSADRVASGADEGDAEHAPDVASRGVRSRT